MLLIRAADRSHVPEARTNEIHVEMCGLGFWTQEDPSPPSGVIASAPESTRGETLILDFPRGLRVGERSVGVLYWVVVTHQKKENPFADYASITG